MKLADIFETRIEEKIDPVIKVAELQDEAKLASEIGSYVVTPMIERYIDEFLEHFTDTIRLQTSEIGAWISGYFGSGKSHLAKIVALVVENRSLQGHAAAKRFEARVPPTAPRRNSIQRNLARIDQCATQVLAFNLNTLVDSKTAPLARLLLSQYYQARGYCSNLLYARVIEHELDRRGTLEALHEQVAALADRPWVDIQKNPGFYAKHLYQAACETAPDAFATPEDVAQVLKNAEKGNLFNVQLLVQTMLDHLATRERAVKKPCRILLVLDESGQWIEDDAGRLAQLQALVEEAAVKGQGRIWIFVTTHEDMGAIYQNARALQADMKKIEGRFRFKWSLTTENIELVLEDRIFKKGLVGKDAVGRAYDAAPGVLRGLGELGNVEGRRLPDCERDRFITFYPFFPYQVHLIPEVVKSLRSRGGRGEQLSGSTRTLLAITQDILRAGRRPYLRCEIGELVSFDEIYGNLAGEGEVSADVRRELSLIERLVPGATELTRRVAEVLHLIGEIAYVPRTIDNIARLLVESTSDDLPSLVSRVQPDLERLIAAKMVARIGDEYEFLTGERRTFEDEVATRAAEMRQQDREVGLAKHFVYDPDEKKNHLHALLGFKTIELKGVEFDARISMDGTMALRSGDVEVRIFSPLEALGGVKITDLEDESLRADERNTILVLCDRIPGLDQDFNRFLAMRDVIDTWKSDSRRSEEARRLAEERERNDLDKLRRKVEAGIKEGLKRAHVVFRGSSRALSPRPGQTPGQLLRAELATYFPSIYPKFEKVPVRIGDEKAAIRDVLAGEKNLAPDVRRLRLYDKSGALDPHSPVVDAIRIFLSTRQARNERTLGRDLLNGFSSPPYGWDGNAVRVAVAACVRAGAIKLLIGKMPHTNPADPALQKALRDSREFDKVEIVLEDAEIESEALEAVRALLIKLTGKRKIDETPAALHDAMEEFGDPKLEVAGKVRDWAEAAGFPLPTRFHEGFETLSGILALTNPNHRVKEILARAEDLERGVEAMGQLAQFHEKWRLPFHETKHLADQLQAIDHLLPAEGGVRGFLAEYRAAFSSARLAEPEVWKSVQTGKAAAALELEALLESRREEARHIAESALDRLPGELAEHDLPEELAGEIAAPLNVFIAALDGEREPARIAALPELVHRIVREVSARIQSEVEKRRKRDGGPPPREVRRVRFTDVTSTCRVRTDIEWEELAKRLDQRVRTLLPDFDVEFE